MVYWLCVFLSVRVWSFPVFVVESDSSSKERPLPTLWVLQPATERAAQCCPLHRSVEVDDDFGD